MKSILIFILDDDRTMAETISILLEENGFSNHEKFTNPDHLIKALRDEVRICIVDYRLNGPMNGLDVIEEIRKTNPQCYFIMLSGMRSYEVIEQYCNIVMRGKYVTKGELDTDKKIIRFIHEFIEDIKLIRHFYRMRDDINESIKELRDIINKQDNAT
jgi:DNA-binding NarL/FixJ family response regulator